MKALVLGVLVLSISACAITSDKHAENNENLLTEESGNLINAQTNHHNNKDATSAALKPCPASNETKENHLSTCKEAMEGVAEIIHPVEDVDIDLGNATNVSNIEAANNNQENAKEENNLWFRVRNQFTFTIPKNEPRLDAQVRWYKKHPAYMQRVSKRAAPFLHYIVERLEQENMPLELALLPIVESAFDPFAYSHGRASGMWQFIGSTGKRFGMPQTWWYDGRRDVIASTEGAIKYLQYLNKMFDGDWLHALAAYNSGEGRVMRAIKKNKRRGKEIDFWSLDLPRETRAYVPKLLALADILTHADKYSFQWPALPNEAVVEVVELGSQVDLALAAKMAGMTITEVQALNPGFNRWATDPDGPHRILLPISKAKNFRQELAKTPVKDRLNWVRHKVKSGESLGVIARKYSSSIDVIQAINDIRGNTIYAGDFLLVPVSLSDLSAYSLSVDQRLAKVQSAEREGTKIEHIVKSGDTLWDIAMAHKVGVRELAKWNKMAPRDPLKIGSKLVVWQKNNSVKSSNLNLPRTNNNAVMRSVVYTVRSGDSLARIANRFKVKISDLTKWNKLNKNKYLQPGQKIKINVDVTES